MSPDISISSISKVFALICGFSLLVSSCGSGGGSVGGGAKDATLNAENAPQAFSAAVQIVGLGANSPIGTASGLGGLPKVKTPSKQQLRSIINRALFLSRDSGGDSDFNNQINRLKKGSIETEDGCSDGGSRKINASWDGPVSTENPSEKMNLQGTITYRSCTEGTETLNGTLMLATQGPLDNPTKATLSSPNFSSSDTLTGDNLNVSNFKIVLENTTFVDAGQTGVTTATVDGAINGTIGGDPIDLEMDSFKIVSSTNYLGETLSVSGRVKILCLDGWVTVTTPTEIFISPYENCPTGGEMAITSGGNTVKVVYEPDSQITLHFNDTLVETFDDCEGVGGLCAA